MSASRPGEEYHVAVCYGTRPQVIKASLLLAVLRERWTVTAIDTGQHYDYELNALLYEQLRIDRPDEVLDVGSADHATQTAAILTRASAVFRRIQPDLVVVIGDTNSTLGAALAAAKARIPVVHVEAGLRAEDVLMAEEINRRVVDSFATVLCAPSESAERRLRRERDDAHIVRTGDIACDVLHTHLARATSRSEHAGAAFVTLHRAELTDDPERLRDVLMAIGRLGRPVTFAMHPRTRAAIDRHELWSAIGSDVKVTAPLGYLEALRAVRDAAIVVTDSGGVQREAYWLGVPCVTLRSETEWQETIDRGANRLVPPSDAERLPEIANLAVAADRGWKRDAYGNGNARHRIVDAIEEWRNEASSTSREALKCAE